MSHAWRYATLSMLAALTAAFPFSSAGGAPVADETLSPTCPDATTPVAVEPERLAADRTHYEAEDGFVGLYLVHHPQDHLVALFDLDARDGAALPAPIESATGLGLTVAGDRFAPLIGPPQPDNPPLIPVGCADQIRPGARLSTPVGGCTVNFIFRDAANNRYFGTAGHCFNALGQRGSVGGLGQVGTVVYRLSAGVGNDFALVRVDANRVNLVNPAMCHWGGPTGIDGEVGAIVRHYGWPIGYSTLPATRPRSGLGWGSDADSFTFVGTVASGDSGSGARNDDGTGLGIITHVNIGLILFAHSAPFAFGTRLDQAIGLAEAATGLDLTLLTAPVA